MQAVKTAKDTRRREFGEALEKAKRAIPIEGNMRYENGRAADSEHQPKQIFHRMADDDIVRVGAKTGFRFFEANQPKMRWRLPRGLVPAQIELTFSDHNVKIVA